MDLDVLLCYLVLTCVQETASVLFLQMISSSYFLQILGINYFNVSLSVVYIHAEIHIYNSAVLSTNT